MRDALLESATYDRILCPVPDDHLSGFLTGFEESPASRLASARAKTACENWDEVGRMLFRPWLSVRY